MLTQSHSFVPNFTILLFITGIIYYCEYTRYTIPTYTYTLHDDFARNNFQVL